MSVIISRKMTLREKQTGATSKPIFGWRNYVDRGNITADFEDVYFPVTNLGNSNTAMSWKSTSTDEQNVYIQLGGAREVDYIAVARHNLGSGFVEISVSAVPAGEEGNPPIVLYDGVMLGSDKPTMIRFDPIYPTQIIITLKPTDTPPEVGILYVGKSTIMLRGIAQSTIPLDFSYQTEVSTGRSESGDFLGRIITDQTKTVLYNFEHISYEWFKEEFAEFADISLTRPFFFVWLPKMLPDEVGFGWLNSDIRPEAVHHVGGLFVDFNLDITAIS